MSNGLWIPDGKGGYRQEDGTYTVRLELPPIEIPCHLREDFAINPKAEDIFIRAVQQALTQSLSDPRTRLREPTVRAVKERIEMCYSAIATMRHDLKYPLKKCCDLLPAALMRALLGSGRLEDELAASEGDKMWRGQAPDAIHEVDRKEPSSTMLPLDDIAPEAATVAIAPEAEKAAEEV
jgi:hypothetical protein